VSYIDQITENDVTLTFDSRGRLWTFRSASPTAQAMNAVVDGTDLVVTVAARDAHPGDIEVDVRDDVLEITNAHLRARGATCSIRLPKHAEMHTLQTAYRDDAFEVRVPLMPAAEQSTDAAVLEAEAVAC
jgi:hypothetical protein